jgi:uracil-DNA glycosylase
MPMNVDIETSWKAALKDEFNSAYFRDLKSFLKQERASHTLYPAGQNIFSAFNKTPINEVKVVILGQDPYHGANQANGLCFSVNPGVKIPPSLKNIYKELNTDIGMNIPGSGDLSTWAEQGVLLLNSVLTVRAHEAASHKNKGWEKFTDAVIRGISNQTKDVIFILWGNYAKKKGQHIDTTKHHIITSAHPSPLSAHNGFLGSKPFSKTNSILNSLNKQPIEWDSVL